MRISLLVVSGPNQGKTINFDRHDTFIVGRGSTAHLRLPPKDKYFSRNHFLLEVNPPLCRLTNLSTSNGTFVNGKKVTTVDLNHGDVIVGGDTAIRVVIEEPRTSLAKKVREEGLGRSEKYELPPCPPSEGNGGPHETLPDNLASPSLNGLAPTLLVTPPPAAAQRAAANEPPKQEQPGRSANIGPYEFVRELGKGGMGTVYLARHIADSTLCAVKTIQPAVAAEEAEIQRFLREASILQRLRHEHIVSYRACGHENDRVYFAMEYVEGRDASQLLKLDSRLSPSRASMWIIQLLTALRYAHSQGFVHRDIKPANLLIEKRGEDEHLKLADFGLARVYHTSTISGLTMEGDIGGSLPFMPPEQLTDYRNVAPTADIYSVGATLYNLLTGKYVYDLPQRMGDRMVMILQNDPIDIGERHPMLPEALKQVIRRALKRKPNDRFQSAQEMLDAMEAQARLS